MAAYDVTTATTTPLEFDAVLMLWPSKPIAVDTNHFFAIYGGDGNDGYAEVFAVNTTSWAVTSPATRLEHNVARGTDNTLVQIDVNHFVGFYAGSGTDGFAQVFTVNTTTWAVTTAAASLEFDTVLGTYNSAVKVDTNHFINFWSGNGSDGFVQVFTVNTTTWAVTTAAGRLEFDTVLGQHNSAVAVDVNHFINFWAGNGSDGFAQVFTVNTTTWAVTTAAARLEYDTVAGLWNSGYVLDTNHFINFYQGAGGDGFAQVFTVNTTTWAVSTASDRLEFDTQDYVTNTNNAVSQIDDNHFIHVWAGPDTGAGTNYDGFAQIFEVNTTSWSVSTSGAPFEFNTTQGEYNAISEIIAGEANKFLLLYAGSGNDGFAEVLSVDVPPTVVLNTPSDTSTGISTTPTLEFTGTDNEADDVRYNMQIDTVNTFDSTTGSETTETFTTAGAGSWTAPAGVTSVAVEVWGAGGGGGGADTVDAGAGAGGGAYSAKTLTVSPGSGYSYTVGAGGTGNTGSSDGTVGGDTDFNGVGSVLAKGGGAGGGGGPVNGPGSGGASVSGVGDTKFSGGDGANRSGGDADGGGGGGGAGDAAVGGNASTTTGGTGGATGGGDGGAGGTSSGNGGVGTQPGGGGGGGAVSGGDGGNGADGKIVLTYTPKVPIIDAISGTDAGFANTVTGGDTDPFNSGEKADYDVQAGDTLSTSTTYYWRVAAKDPTGSNAYGQWSTIWSFTTEAGAGGTASLRTLVGTGRGTR